MHGGSFHSKTALAEVSRLLGTVQQPEADVIDVEAHVVPDAPAPQQPRAIGLDRQPRRGVFRPDQLPQWPAYVQQYDLPLVARGRHLRGPCVLHGGTRDSFTANAAGPWLCQSCQAKGGDTLEFHRQRWGLGFVEAARELGAWEEADGTSALPARLHRTAQATRSPGRGDDGTDHERKLAQAAAILAAAVPAAHSEIAVAYLQGRACVVPPEDGDLLFVPDLRVFGFAGPALVGKMTLASDARVLRGLHLTWLEPDGSGWRRRERRYLAPKQGCVVRLWPDEAITRGLAIAEGVESALALAHAYMPGWACMDAGNLTAFPVLTGIESLLIAADNDESGTGQRAAQACAERWAAAGREVAIVAAPEVGADINDLARAA